MLSPRPGCAQSYACHFSTCFLVCLLVSSLIQALVLGCESCSKRLIGACVLQSDSYGMHFTFVAPRGKSEASSGQLPVSCTPTPLRYQPCMQHNTRPGRAVTRRGRGCSMVARQPVSFPPPALHALPCEQHATCRHAQRLRMSVCPRSASLASHPNITQVPFRAHGKMLLRTVPYGMNLPIADAHVRHRLGPC